MLSRRTALWALTALLVPGLLVSSSCKNEVPTGQITPVTVNVKVDAIEHVELVLGSKFDGVQREMWKVEPAELGVVYFDQASPQRRKATFRGKAAGKGKLVVHGFFGREPKPYQIAEVPVTVQ